MADDIVNVKESGIDLDGDIVFTMNGKKVYVNLRKEWHDGYISGQKDLYLAIVQHATAELKRLTEMSRE